MTSCHMHERRLDNVCELEQRSMFYNAAPICCYTWLYYILYIHQARNGAHYPAVLRSDLNHDPAVLQSVLNHDPAVLQSVLNHDPAVLRSDLNHDPAVLQYPLNKICESFTTNNILRHTNTSHLYVGVKFKAKTTRQHCQHIKAVKPLRLYNVWNKP